MNGIVDTLQIIVICPTVCEGFIGEDGIVVFGGEKLISTGAEPGGMLALETRISFL
jgi:hypothetical protein